MTSKIHVQDPGGFGFYGPSDRSTAVSSMYITDSTDGTVEISIYRGSTHKLAFNEVEAVRDFLTEWMFKHWPQEVDTDTDD